MNSLSAHPTNIPISTPFNISTIHQGRSIHQRLVKQMNVMEDAESVAVSNDAEISKLCKLSPSSLKIFKGSSKLSKISLARVKELAVYLSLNKCLSKGTLIDNIVMKRKR